MSIESVQQSAKKADVEASSVEELFARFEPMMMMFARKTWNYIPESHRRHISFEDVLQEARMRGWTAIRTHDPTKSSICTWMYRTLNMRMREVNAPFTDPSRNRGRVGLVQTFDDLEGSDLSVLVRDSESCVEALSSFEAAYQESPPATQQLFLDALGFRTKIRFSAQAYERSVALDISTRFKLSESDFRLLRRSDPERTLTVAIKHTKTVIPKIDCIVCEQSFSLMNAGDSIDYKTVVCSNCNKVLQQQEKGDIMAETKTVAPIEDDPFEDSPIVEATEPAAKPSKQAGKTIVLDSEEIEVDSDDEDDEDADYEFDGEADDEDDEETDESEDDAEDAGDGDKEFDDAEDEDVIVKTKPTAAASPKPSRQKAQEPTVPTKKTPTQPAAAGKIKIVTSAAKKTAPASKTEPVQQGKTKLVAVGKPAKAVLVQKPLAKPSAKSAKAAKTSPKVAATFVKASVKAVKASAKPAKKTARTMKDYKPQAWTATSPFRPGTHLQNVVDQLVEAGDAGVKLVHIQKYAEKHNINWRGFRNNLVKGKNFSGQFEWKLTITGEGPKRVATLKFTKKPSAEFRRQVAAARAAA